MTEQGNRPDDAIRVPGTDRVFNRQLMLVPLLAILAMTMMAISSINVALPSIELSIGASEADLQWLLSGYALAFGIVLVASGRLGDVFGRSTYFVIGVALFTLGSLGCSLAHTPALLNGMRLLQGVGAGVSSPQVNGMILQYFSGRRRARAFALFGVVVSASVAIAPSITGLLIDWLGPDWGWRASFLWNVPIGLITVGLAARWLPFGAERGRRAARQRGEQVRTHIDLDPVGMIGLSLVVLCVLLPFMLKRPAGFGLLAVGAVLLVGWVYWERGYKNAGHEPMVDLYLFGYRSFTNGILVSGTQFLGGTSIFAVLALFLQSGLGAPALIVGLIGLPNAVASAFSSMWAGEHVLDSGRRNIVLAFVVYLVGIIGAIVLAQFTGADGGPIHYAWLAVPLILTGYGVGVINSSNQTLSQQHIPPAVGGTAGAVKQVAERIGTAIGNAMITAVLFSLATTDWVLGFTAAYGVIALILSVALIFAIIDLRMLGDGGAPLPRPTV